MQTIQLLPPLALDTQPPQIVAFLAEVAKLPERSFPSHNLDTERRKYLRRLGLIEKNGKGRYRLTMKCIDELRQLHAMQSDDTQHGQDIVSQAPQHNAQKTPERRKPKRAVSEAWKIAIFSVLGTAAADFLLQFLLNLIF